MQVPDWWLRLTAWYFGFGVAAGVLSVILLVALIIVVLRILPLIKALQGKVELVGQKVEVISDRVEDITSKAQHTMALVHSRTTAITGTAEEHSADITKRLGMISAGVTGLFTLLRVLKFVRKLRS